MMSLALFSCVLRPRAAGAAPLPETGREAGPALGTDLDDAVQGAARPAYRFVEGIADGVYEFARIHIVGRLLPGRFNRNLAVASDRNSDELFAQNLRAREADLLRRERAAYPVAAAQTGPIDCARLQDWRMRFLEEQQGVALNALTDTLLQRYRIKALGHASVSYMKERQNRDAGSLTMAGLLSGAAFYLNGLHAAVPLAGLRLKIDLRPGWRLRRTLGGDGACPGWANLELGYKNAPITATMEWGVAGGRARAERRG